MSKYLRLLIVITGVALASVPLEAQSRGPYKGPSVANNRLRVNLGFFRPDGDSAYWNDKELEFTGRPDDFEDFSFGLDYLRLLNERLGLLVASSFYEGDARQSYIDFVDTFGAPISHNTTLSMATFELGLLFHFVSRDAPVIPYVGIAGGLYAWELEESGDFINFSFRDPEIFSTRFSDDGETFGWSLLAGLEIPLSLDWSVFAEGRWQDAEDELGGDFQGFGTLDLSGKGVRIGMTWGF
jgi:opacity protein-like surface antigen